MSKTYELRDEGTLTRLVFSDGGNQLFVSRDDADEEGRRLTQTITIIQRGRIPVRDRMRMRQAAAYALTMKDEVER